MTHERLSRCAKLGCCGNGVGKRSANSSVSRFKCGPIPRIRRVIAGTSGHFLASNTSTSPYSPPSSLSVNSPTSYRTRFPSRFRGEITDSAIRAGSDRFLR